MAVLLFVATVVAQQPRRIDDDALRKTSQTGDDWLTYGFNQAETRYSPLNEINTSNVTRLGLAWAYDVGSGGGGQEATPIVVNGTIYASPSSLCRRRAAARSGR
jgi:quinohemoprotein ethanol dehydrogenase